MIPSEITDLLNDVRVGHVGTRDGNLQGTEVFSWIFAADPKENILTVFIPAALAGQTISNLQDNGRIAVTYSHPLKHSSYQLKGRLSSHRAASAEETESIKKAIDLFYTGYLGLFGYPAEIVSTIRFAPATAITFHVEEAFNQTPGPNAGQKINLP